MQCRIFLPEDYNYSSSHLTTKLIWTSTWEKGGCQHGVLVLNWVLSLVCMPIDAPLCTTNVTTSHTDQSINGII